MTRPASHLAADLLRTEPITYAQAGARFGVTHQAASFTYLQMYGNAPTAYQLAIRERDEIALGMIASGSFEITEITRELDMSRSAVYPLVALIDEHPPSSRRTDPGMIAAGIEAVRVGETIAEGAAIADVSYRYFMKKLREAGVRSTHVGGRDKRGLSAEASAAMDLEDISLGKASKRFGVSEQSIVVWRRRRGLPVPWKVGNRPFGPAARFGRSRPARDRAARERRAA